MQNVPPGASTSTFVRLQNSSDQANTGRYPPGKPAPTEKKPGGRNDMPVANLQRLKHAGEISSRPKVNHSDEESSGSFSDGSDENDPKVIVKSYGQSAVKVCVTRIKKN